MNSELQAFVDYHLKKDLPEEQKAKIHSYSQEALLLDNLFDECVKIDNLAKKQKKITEVIFQDAGYRLALGFINEQANKRAEAALNEQAKLRSRKQETLGRAVRGEPQGDMTDEEYASAMRYAKAFHAMQQFLNAGGSFQATNLVRGKQLQYDARLFQFNTANGAVYLLQPKSYGGKVALSYLDVCQYGEALPETKVL